MDLTRYVDELQRQLSTAAAAGGDEAHELAGRLTAPLDAAARLVLLEALSAAAGEISAELAPGSVDVRLRGGEPEFVVAAPAAAPAPTSAPAVASAPTPSPSAPANADADGGATTRTTLRLPDHLKTQAEAAAARDGVSVNTWLVRAVAAALDQPTGRPEQQTGPGQPSTKRLTGWVR
ncbi:toxin-antitoxin system HicB family antitoxin [Promicromonospora panici]|uniref:toxin-antitoxin system HicB family antitoxin n=1 Tax=Promicromonospora panici TaxID=2219658 RepID=UPI00101D69D9|nr:toxin-antitoxin system HicB family antitoxin [Promicromonospora panici]